VTFVGLFYLQREGLSLKSLGEAEKGGAGLRVIPSASGAEVGDDLAHGGADVVDVALGIPGKRGSDTARWYARSATGNRAASSFSESRKCGCRWIGISAPSFPIPSP